MGEMDATLRTALDSARATMTLSVRDWAQSKDTAWLWGIIVGWDDAALAELAARFKWEPCDVERLKSCRAAVAAASWWAPEEPDRG